MNDEKRKISIDEIARRLSVPRHFLGKIMKAVVKAGILSSARGQQGGFFINDKTMGTPILTIVMLTEDKSYFNTCLLSMRVCDPENPCPMHSKVEKLKNEFLNVYSQTTIGDLLKENKPEFIKSLAANLLGEEDLLPADVH
jgi:Rrf2 family protein